MVLGNDGTGACLVKQQPVFVLMIDQFLYSRCHHSTDRVLMWILMIIGTSIQ